MPVPQNCQAGESPALQKRICAGHWHRKSDAVIQETKRTGTNACPTELPSRRVAGATKADLRWALASQKRCRDTRNKKDRHECLSHRTAKPASRRRYKSGPECPPYRSKYLQVRVPLPGAVQANQRLTAKMSRLLLQTNPVTHKYARINSLQLSAFSSQLLAIGSELHPGDESPG